MNSADLIGLRQSQDIGVGADKLLFGVLQGFLEGGPGLQPHRAGNTRFLGTHNIDGGSVHLGNVTAAHHGEAVEGVEGVAEAVLANILLIGSGVLAITVHVGENVHVIMLEHLV